MPNFNTTTIWTSTFEWYMVRCGSKNKHQKGMSFKGIILCVQTILINLGSLVNIIWGGGLGSRCPLNEQGIFIMIIYKIFTCAPKIMMQITMGTIWICNHLTLIVCVVSFEK